MTDAKDKRIVELEREVWGMKERLKRHEMGTPTTEPESVEEAIGLPPRCTHQVPAGNARTTRMVDCGRDEPCLEHPESEGDSDG